MRIMKGMRAISRWMITKRKMLVGSLPKELLGLKKLRLEKKPNRQMLLSLKRLKIWLVGPA